MGALAAERFDVAAPRAASARRSNQTCEAAAPDSGRRRAEVTKSRRYLTEAGVDAIRDSPPRGGTSRCAARSPSQAWPSPLCRSRDRPPLSRRTVRRRASGAAARPRRSETLATRAAVNALKKGGNAVDAAITAAGRARRHRALLCGVGGGGFSPRRQGWQDHPHAYALDGRAPARSDDTELVHRVNGTALQFNDARYSGLSVGRPRTPLTWVPRSQVRDDLAREGARARNCRGERRLRGRPDVLRPDRQNLKTTSTTSRRPRRSTSTRTGRRGDVGNDLSVNPDLAKTYQLLARGGAQAFYNGGAIPQAIVQTVTQSAGLCRAPTTRGARA